MTTRPQLRIIELQGVAEGAAAQYAYCLSRFVDAMIPRILDYCADEKVVRDQELELSLLVQNRDAAKNKDAADDDIKTLQSELKVNSRALKSLGQFFGSEERRWHPLVLDARKQWIAALGCVRRKTEAVELQERNGEPARADTSPQQ